MTIPSLTSTTESSLTQPFPCENVQVDMRCRSEALIWAGQFWSAGESCHLMNEGIVHTIRFARILTFREIPSALFPSAIRKVEIRKEQRAPLYPA